MLVCQLLRRGESKLLGFSTGPPFEEDIGWLYVSFNESCILKGILMYTYESVEALRCCIRLRIFISRFEMTLSHPYETAEALCRRRNKVPTAAEWLVI